MQLLVPIVSASTFVVRPDGTGDFATIQDAINASRDGDVVELTDGTFTGDGNRDIDFSGKAIVVRSQSGDPETCVLDCRGEAGDPHFGLEFDDGEGSDSVLDAVTITNGYAAAGASPYVGGGITCIDSSPILRECIFSRNTGTEGAGGLHCTGELGPRVLDCRFIENESLNHGGGGMASVMQADPQLIRAVFRDNHSGTHGGGLLITGETQHAPSPRDCVFTGNTAALDGGAVAALGGSSSLSGCVFTNNRSGRHGGAVFVRTGISFSAVRCVFGDNTAGEAGGGLALLDGITSVSECTFANNRSTIGFGGGIALGAAYLNISSTIIAFSSWGAAMYCSVGADLSVECCDLFGNVGGDWIDCLADDVGEDGNISEDPLFCDLEGGNYSVREDSPCADAHAPPGCFRIGALFDGCSVTDVVDGLPSRTQLRVHPNPMGVDGVVQWTDKNPGPGTLRVYDPGGRVVVSRTFESGAYEVRWLDLVGSRALARGQYFLEWTGTTGDRRVVRMVRVR
jgi:predicted outer membrane repeat protein